MYLSQKTFYGVFTTEGAGASIWNWRVLVKIISPGEIACGQMRKFCNCDGWGTGQLELPNLISDESSSELNGKRGTLC